MSRLCIIGAKDAGNLTVDLQFSDQTTRRVDIGDFIRLLRKKSGASLTDVKQVKICDETHIECSARGPHYEESAQT